MRSLVLILVLFLLPGKLLAAHDSLYRVISTEATKALSLSERGRLSYAALKVVDDYMTLNKYDSSQIWLNAIVDLYNHLPPTKLNYYFASRNAEIYYYNQLFQLGLKEASNGRRIAHALNDSILITDGCNLTGLLYLNMDSLQEAKHYFHAGLSYAVQPPYSSSYLPVSNPHHLFSNLAECCARLRQWDSAHHYNFLSLQKATLIADKRGMAVANHNIGNLLLRNSSADSASNRFLVSSNLARANNDWDVVLVNFIGLAECALRQKDLAKVDRYLDSGFALMRERPEINALFSRDFLKGALRIFRGTENEGGLLEAYTKLTRLDSIRHQKNIGQVQHILQGNISKENRMLKMQINVSEQRQEIANARLYIALALILLLLIGIAGYRYYFTQKIRLVSLRNNISRDLHDDVGATLSSIHIYGSIAKKTMDKDPQKAKDVLQHITDSTKQLVENMSDIVWAINGDQAAERSFSSRVKNYGYDLLNSTGIACDYDIEEQFDQRLTNPQSRKNLLLIVKEAVNNIVKYSEAQNVVIGLHLHQKGIVLKILDNGKGFDLLQARKGNGMNNIISRTNQLKGNCEIFTAPGKGTEVRCTFPVAIISDKL